MSKNDFKLPNEKVVVKFVHRKRGMAANVGSDHVISGGMLDNTFKRFVTPLQRNGSIANVLTTEEKNHIEEIMGGVDLSIYGDFWKEFSVQLWKNDTSNVFDLSDPIDYLSVKLLERNTDDIAPSWADRHNKQTYQFAITREGEVSNEAKAVFNVKKEAFKMYGKIEDDRDKLVAVLRLLTNRPISSDSKLDWVQKEVENFVDKEPQSFVNVITDSSFDTKKMIHEAMEVGYIKRNGNSFTTADGLILNREGDVPSFSNTVRFLEDDENFNIKSIIEAKIEEGR